MAVTFGALLLAGIMLGIFLPLGWLENRPPGPAAIGLIVFLVAFWLSFGLFFGVIGYFMPFVMYRQRCSAARAFVQVIRLIASNLGSFVLFVLFGIVLVMAVIVISCIATCLTCCLAALPYVGTVLLLPMFVWLRGFGLFFFRQFGPDYDVWATLPQPEPPAPPPPLPA